MSTVLTAKNLTMMFGGLRAVSEFELKIEPGELGGLNWSQRSRENHSF
jgi:ABC-type branched-subunit amino acid transport system ATPase component